MFFKSLLFSFIAFSASLSFAQVGLNTLAPEAYLDINAADAGILLPRVTLTSATVAAPVTNPTGATLVDGTMVWNTGTGALTPAGFYYWQGGQWNQLLANNEQQVYFGKLLLTSTGNITISTLPFRPKSIEFLAINRVQGFNQGAARAVRGASSPTTDNNTNDIRMAGGFTSGYARNYSGSTIDQQAISYGHSGSSLNNIGTYASESHCIAAFFVTNNGEPLRDNGNNSGGNQDPGLVSASLTSFTNNGFTLNVDQFISGGISNPGTNNQVDRTNTIVVIYKAYKY